MKHDLGRKPVPVHWLDAADLAPALLAPPRSPADGTPPKQRKKRHYSGFCEAIERPKYLPET
jgi:hypothetical protein